MNTRSITREYLFTRFTCYITGPDRREYQSMMKPVVEKRPVYERVYIYSEVYIYINIRVTYNEFLNKSYPTSKALTIRSPRFIVKFPVARSISVSISRAVYLPLPRCFLKFDGSRI